MKHRKLDATIISWSEQLNALDRDYKLTYRNMKSEAAVKNFASLMLHFFNHQPHPRPGHYLAITTSE
ncbi:MAG: hypothetical protein ACXV8Q_10995 [Methylobacter sp.]